MRKLIILSIMVFQAILVNAQGQGQGQGKRNGGGGGAQNQTMPAFNIENSAGIINYDVYDIFESLKLEADADMQHVATAISAYNQNIEDIKLANHETITSVTEFVAAAKTDAMSNRNREAMMAVQAEANEKLAPVKVLVTKADQTLNESLGQDLSSKQFKKWEKYQAAEKNSLKPKQYSNAPAGGQKGSGRGGGSRY